MAANDTIVALSTPPGRSGIGVVRLSGPNALSLARSLLRDESFAPESHRAYLKSVRDPESGDVLDRALVTYFRAPHSFTGEGVIEISCHGSPPLLLRVLDVLLLLGARAANPGEFTLRALSNGRFNLTQAEAIRDLIDAQTFAAVKQAARQLNGELSVRLQPIKESLLKIIVPLESALEFVEDDLPEDITRDVEARLSNLIQQLNSLAHTFQAGRLLREGLRVTLVGRPNAGKSSLFNALLSYERAIVTSIPGTTRDSLSEPFNLEGVPILLVDTAGLRESADEIERLGINRTRRAIADADLAVLVLDGSQPLTLEDYTAFGQVCENKHLIAINKCDTKDFDVNNVAGLSDKSCAIIVSAKTGQGIKDLSAAILKAFAGNLGNDSDFLITNARHYDLLRRSSEVLASSRTFLAEHASEELILVGLYGALNYLGEITGETTNEDVLSQIFATFCIGK